jgi:ABC-type glycerol-3-phosphate transport system permease component
MVSKILNDPFYFVSETVRNVVLLVAVLIVMFPVFWILSTSLRSNQETQLAPPNWLPRTFTVKAYSLPQLGGEGTTAGMTAKFVPNIANGVWVAFWVTLISVVLATTTGYSFSRFTFAGRKSLLVLLLNTQMFPYIAIIVPLYIMYRSLGLLNTFTGLILGQIGLVLPFGIWMIKNFCDTINKEMEEAALLEGASRLHILWSIVVPTIRPGIISVAMFSFLTSWNHLLYVMILNTRDSKITAPLGLMRTFADGFFTQFSEMSAGIVILSAPVVIVFIWLQKYFATGLTAGAMKG